MFMQRIPKQYPKIGLLYGLLCITKWLLYYCLDTSVYNHMYLGFLRFVYMALLVYRLLYYKY